MRSWALERFPLPAYLSSKADAVDRQRIYMLPTRAGLVFCVLLLLMLLGAINYNNSMAYVLTFLLGSMCLITMLHTYRNLAGLVMNEMAVTAVFAGDVALFPLLLDNRNRRQRVALGMVLIETIPWYKQLARVDDAEVLHFDVPADRLHRVELPYQTRRRGWCSTGSMKVFTTFPLGLFYTWSCVRLQQRCLVYPRASGRQAFPTLRPSGNSGTQGQSMGTDDFVGFRDYVAGDPVKDIAWKMYACEKGLLIKQFRGSGADRLSLGWHDVINLAKVESRLSQLCLWLVRAEAQSLNYSLSMPTARVEFNQGKQHLCDCLALLAQYGDA